jgi:hypothetical protein
MVLFELILTFIIYFLLKAIFMFKFINVISWFMVIIVIYICIRIKLFQIKDCSGEKINITTCNYLKASIKYSLNVLIMEFIFVNI